MGPLPLVAAATAGGIVSFAVGLMVIKVAKAALVMAVGGAALAAAWTALVRRRG